MKYTLSNTIHGSLHDVAQKMSNPEGTKQWTEGLETIEQISGSYCDVGSTRHLHYRFRNREMMITETVLKQQLPSQITFSYDSSMGQNIVKLSFEELPNNQVKQTVYTTMVLKGAMKLFGFMFKPMFKKQSKKYMTAFKEYVEA